MSDKLAELEAQLEQAQSQREKIDALNELAWEIRNDDSDKSLELAQKAYELSNNGDFAAKPYAMGQASSLTTRAYLDRNGPLDEALEKCFQALALIEGETPNPVVVRNMRLVCWLYFYLGEYSKALTFGLKALQVSKEGGFKGLTAAVLNSLTMVFAVTGDFNQALKMSSEALELSREIHDDVQEMGALNNGANVYLEQGELDQALELATQAWEIAQRMEASEARSDASDTLGQVLQTMGEYGRAEQLLIETVKLDTQTGNEWGQANGLLGLGKLHLSKGKFEQANSYLQKSLELSNKTGSHQLQMECHASLSQIAEQQEKWEQALAHHKTFHKLYQENHNDTASRRLAALKVAHQVETTKRDAEIYHLRNEELLREIDERKKAEQALQALATTDPLTNLHNRRHFFEKATAQLAQAMRYRRPLSVLILDIDNFKQINDGHGHLAGDRAIQHLARTIKHSLRTVDIVARFGGDEFVVLLPETNATQALVTAERLRQKVAEELVRVQRSKFKLTISIGIASLEENVETVDGLLEKADRALYTSKAGGRNQVQVYENPINGRTSWTPL